MLGAFCRNGKVFCKSTGGGTVYAPLEVIMITFFRFFWPFANFW